MPINQNQALFSLLGTTYGGNGQTNFALPNLRGRVPIHVGAGFTLGQLGGEEAHNVTINELPQHLHLVSAAQGNGDSPIPSGNLFGAFNNAYRAPGANSVALPAATVSNLGGSQPHSNMSPYLVLTYGIALQGIFPSPN